MNGGQDLGGMMGFGPIAPELNEPVLHAEWERRAFAMTLAMGMTGSWNIDISRHARETLPPAQYLSSSYYEVWFAGLEKLLAQRGLVTADEIDAGKASVQPKPLVRRPKTEEIPALLARGGPASREASRPAAFAIGDKVRTRNIHPETHTRLPRYLRGKQGEIVAAHGAHVLPDSNAHGRGEDPRWLYTVRFTAQEVWGRNSSDTICADLWEPYLERA